MADDSPKRQLYEAQIQYLVAGDVEGLVDNQYTEDATLVSFTNQIHGNAALKEYISSGAWKSALEKTVGPSGYDIPSPPTVGG